MFIDCPGNVGVCCLSSFTNCRTPCLDGIAVARDMTNDFIEEAQCRCRQVHPFAAIGMLLQLLEQIFAFAGGVDQA